MSKFYYLKKVEDHKYGFVYTKEFETDGVLNDIEITRCVDFANRMVWGEGYHRGKRSGGIKERSEKEKFVNTLQGKITECALHKYLQDTIWTQAGLILVYLEKVSGIRSILRVIIIK